MANVLIVYGSTTGNTASVAEMIEPVLTGGGHSVTLLDAAKATPDTSSFATFIHASITAFRAAGAQ